MKYVLVATADRQARETIQGSLQGRYAVESVGDADVALSMFESRRYEYTFLELAFLVPPGRGDQEKDLHAVLAPYRQAFPAAQLIVLAPPGQVRAAVELVRAGADNYLTRPVEAAELEFVLTHLNRRQRLESELNYLRASAWPVELKQAARSNSPMMQAALEKIGSAAPTKSTVLLTGETGTGKSLMARYIHANSARADGPFVAVHCGAIPEGLVESELFGHEKGAFTGAVRRKLGKFQIADGGTIFLDEIGTITPAVQVRLLQVLQEKSFHRVGGETLLNVDVRVVAATNSDLKGMVSEGLFRSDLYYRLNVFPVDLPPLRQRTEDLPLLAESFIGQLNRTHGKDIRELDPEVLAAFRHYPWPGNIRELENLLERAYILERGRVLSPVSFPSELFTQPSLGAPTMAAGKAPTLADVRAKAVDEAQRRYLSELLSLHRGRVDQTAGAAGVTTRQLFNLMAKYGLKKEEFR